MKPTPIDSELERLVSPPDRATMGDREEPEDDQLVATLRLLLQKRALLLRAAVWGLLAATLVSFLLRKEYQSSTRLMPPDNQSNNSLALMATLSGKLAGGLGGLAGDVLGIKSSGALFIGVLRSHTVEDRLIDKFNLKKVYGQRTWEGARTELDANTAIFEDRKSGLITITVTDHDPQRAAAMAQEYVAQLNAAVSQLSTSSARREREFLEARLHEVRQDLEAAEKDFSEFASRNGAIDIKEQGRAMVEAAATLQGQLIAAQSELQGLKQIYSDNNVRVRAVNARVAELRSQLEKLGGKEEIGKDLTDPHDQSLYPSIRKLPLLGVNYADLYRRAKVQEAVFETLTQEYELAKVAEAKETPSVKVLDPAEVPERKSFPPRLQIMLLGTFLSCACIGGWIVAKDRWLRISPERPKKMFVEEVFHIVNASMPWATPNGSRFQATSHKIWTRLSRQNKTKENGEPHLEVSPQDKDNDGGI